MLAAMKLGVVVIPATTLLTRRRVAGPARPRPGEGGDRDPGPGREIRELRADRLRAHRRRRIVERRRLAAVRASADASDSFTPDGPTAADEPMLLYFTSGTTAKPKLVRHSQRSYPVGALSTMYWLGLQPGDVHLQHLLARLGQARLELVLRAVERGRDDLHRQPAALRGQAVAAQPSAAAASPRSARRRRSGGCSSRRSWPTSRSACARSAARASRSIPEVIEQVRAAWGLTIRDGYGQTETTALAGNPPGQKVKVGSMGRPLPGYRVVILDADGQTGERGRGHAGARRRPAGRPDAGLSERRRQAVGRRRRSLSQRRCRVRRRRRLLHLRRPRRRRVQVLRLPHQPVRARKRADRA